MTLPATRTLLSLLTLCCLAGGGCMRKEPTPIPEAQVPFECDGPLYFQRLYPELTSGSVSMLSDGQLLVNGGGTQFLKMDTLGKVLWFKELGDYSSENVFYRRGANLFFSRMRTQTGLRLGLYDEALSTVNVADFPSRSSPRVYMGQDSASIVVSTGTPSISEPNKIVVHYLDAQLRPLWTYREQNGYHSIISFAEDAQYLYFGGGQYLFDEQTGIINGMNAGVFKLDKGTGRLVWFRTPTFPDATFNAVAAIEVLPNGHLDLGGTMYRSSQDRWYSHVEIDENGAVVSRTDGEAPKLPVASQVVEAFGTDRHLMVSNLRSAEDAGDIQAIMLDGSGRELWRNTYGGTGNQYALGAVILPSGNCFIAGTTKYIEGNQGKSKQQLLLIKCDAKGNTCY